MSRSEVSWCCAGFAHHYKSAGQAGACVIALDVLGEVEYVLQFRTFEIGSQSSVQVAPGTMITLGCDVGLTFCPWCGRNLRRHYRKVERQLVRHEFGALTTPLG